MRHTNRVLIIGSGNIGRVCADISSGDSKVIILPQTEPTKVEEIKYDLPMQYYAIEKSGKEKRRERRKKSKNK